MQQTSQIRGKAAEPDAKQAVDRRRPHEQRTLWTAVQAVRAGAPVRDLPPAAVLALSARIGNTALAALVTQQAARRLPLVDRLPDGLPDLHSTPFAAAPSAPQTAQPPAWDGLPVLAVPPVQLIGGETLV